MQPRHERRRMGLAGQSIRLRQSKMLSTAWHMAIDGHIAIADVRGKVCHSATRCWAPILPQAFPPSRHPPFHELRLRPVGDSSRQDWPGGSHLCILGTFRSFHAPKGPSLVDNSPYGLFLVMAGVVPATRRGTSPAQSRSERMGLCQPNPFNLRGKSLASSRGDS
jgi:hypothetical protein